MNIIVKYLLTALMIIIVSDIAKRSDRLGGMIAALPLITIMTLVLMYLDHQPISKIANHAWYTFWYVVPTLPMFLLFPYVLPRFGFWYSLALSSLLTMLLFLGFAMVLRRVGINLL